MLSEVSAAAVILAAIICVVLVLDRVMTKAAPPAEKTWLTDYQYAHRGLHNEHYPENSLPAFANAMKNGFGIELDVHLSLIHICRQTTSFALLRIGGLLRLLFSGRGRIFYRSSAHPQV